MLRLFIFAAAFIAGSAFIASSAFAIDSAYGEWSVSCDNVKRCEAAGYRAAEEDSERALALVVLREAGPNTMAKLTLVVSGRDPDIKTGPVTLTIDGQAMDGIRFGQPMPPALAQRVLRALIDARGGIASEGKEQWPLPLQGMKAALLKMDDVQGRIDTPGALVRRGARPEVGVPAAAPMPVLRAVPAAKYVDDARLLAALLAQIPRASTDEYFQHMLYRFPDGRLLLLRESSRGNTSSYYDVWLANARPPYAPRMLRLPTVDDGQWDELIAADFDGQVLGAYENARSERDCGAVWKWLWTGQRFELLAEYHTKMCAGFADVVEHRKWIARKAP